MFGFGRLSLCSVVKFRGYFVLRLKVVRALIKACWAVLSFVSLQFHFLSCLDSYVQ